MSYVGNTPTQQAFSPAVDYFSGNGSTVAFTLSRPVASVAQVQVTVNNVPQNPSTAFTVSGQTLTFTGTPSSGTNNIYVQYTSPITQVIQPGQGTVGTTQIADNAITTSKIAAGAVVQADLAAGVAGNGPAFSVYRNATQTITSGVWTKVQLNTEEFDTNSNFDPTTNYRFTPTVSGYYQVNASIAGAGSVGLTVGYGAIYKNGSQQIITSINSPNGGVNCVSVVGNVIYMNGSTDYLELYANLTGTGTIDLAFYSTAFCSRFSGSLVRAA